KELRRLLRGEKGASIGNLPIVFGMIAPAGHIADSAREFAVRGFTEALRREVEGSNVFVSCVHPGGIRTPIARHSRLGAGRPAPKREANIARFERLARTPPETAAAKILRGVERQAPRILLGMEAYPTGFLQRLRAAND